MSKDVDNIFGKIALILVFGSALLHGWLSVLQFFVHQEEVLLPVDCMLFIAAAAAVLISILTSRRQVRIRIGHAMTVFLLAALLISCVPASFYFEKNMFYSNRIYLLDTFVTLLLFYPLGHYMGRQRNLTPLRVWLHIQLAVWTGFMIFAIKTAFSYKDILLPAGGALTMGKYMMGLHFNCNTNTTGLIQMIAFLGAILLFFWDKTIPGKVLSAVMVLVNYLGAVLSFSKTSLVVSVLGAGLMVFTWVSRVKSQRAGRSGKKQAAIAAVLFIVALLIINSAVTKAFWIGKEKRNNPSAAGGEISESLETSESAGVSEAVEISDVREISDIAEITESLKTGERVSPEKTAAFSQQNVLPGLPDPFVIRAEASEPEEESAGSNGGFLNRFLTGRPEIWKASVKAMFVDPPQRLLTGISPKGVFVAVFEASGGVHKKNTHNQFLEIGLALGIPSLIVFLCFLGYTIRNIIRLFRNRGTDPALLLLPVLFAMLLLSNMTEATLLFYQFPSAYVFFFVCGLLNERGIRAGKSVSAQKASRSGSVPPKQ